MLSIQETKKVWNIFVTQIFLDLWAIIFDTLIFEHTVVQSMQYVQFHKILRPFSGEPLAQS